MPYLHKYWLKEFFKLFFSVQLVILVLFVFIEYLSMLDKFLSSDISLLMTFGFVFLEIPFMFVQVTPAGVLLANIIVFSLMNRNNELLALKSSGVSTYSILKPSIYSSIMIMVVMFATGETIIPTTMTMAHDIEYHFIKNKKNVVLDKKNFWIKSGKKIIHFEYYNPSKKSVSGICILSPGENFNPDFRLDAAKGYYNSDGGGWIFENIIQQVYIKDTGDYAISHYDQKKVYLGLQPDEIGKLIKKTEEMSFVELKSYVNNVEKEGYDATKYVVDLHGKIAFPFICVIMALAGAATGMKSFAKESIPKAVTLGIIISFFYWFSYGIGISLGYGKFFPPVIAAWITNAFFFCIIFYLNKSTE